MDEVVAAFSSNPPVGLVTPETDPVAPTHKTYDYLTPVPSVKPHQKLDYDQHLDPQLVWAGKKEHTSFEVPTVSLHQVAQWGVICRTEKELNREKQSSDGGAVCFRHVVYGSESPG